MQKGFTLIELLVVVLIIGILAAVAVPQYENAVLKSRAAELLANLKTIRQAADAYYLANGKRPMNFTEIDISFPGMKLEESEGVAESAVRLPNGSYYAFDVDGYIQGSLPKYSLTFNFWYEGQWGVRKGCFLLRTSTEKLKKLGRSMGKFTQINQFKEDVYEIC